jgi:hypothetical protein
MLKQTGLAHTTTFATFSMTRLPNVSEAQFEQTLLAEVLPATDHPLNRVTNVIGQEFRKVVDDDADTYQWVIIWNGVRDNDRVAEGSMAIYDNVKNVVDRVGTRTGLSLAILEARWQI